MPTRDLQESLDFYQALGFENRDAAMGEWSYLIVGRGDLELHFFLDPDVDPFSSAATCYAYVADAQLLYDAWSPCVVADPATGSRLVPPVDTDYGMREFALVDRSGNLVRVGSPLPL